MRTSLTSVAPLLVARLEHAGCTPDALRDYLGAPAVAALERGDVATVEYALTRRTPAPGSSTDAESSHNREELAILVRAMMLHQPVLLHDLQRALGYDVVEGLSTFGGLQRCDEPKGSQEAAEPLVRVTIDVRKIDNGVTEQRAPATAAPGSDYAGWVFSDMDASCVFHHVPGRDHVLGVGAASLSLLRSTPRTKVGSVLDLGTGSGVQTLAQLGCASHITATDIHPRALDFAEASLATAQSEGAELAEVELLEGAWFEPVQGRRFDRVISNPPFVVGPAEVAHVYRDSGLELDGATELVVTHTPAHLNPEGHAHLLGAWATGDEEDPGQRIASWLPDHGVEAWILERDSVDVMTYIHTWLLDESVDPRSPEGHQKTRHWLETFERHGVTTVGFGYIALRRLADTEPTEVLFERFPQHFEDELGGEIAEHFARSAWLRSAERCDLLASRYRVREGVVKEDLQEAASHTSGFLPLLQRLTRTDGPRWSHEVDEHLASIVAGLHPEGLSLEEVVSLYCLSHGLNETAVQSGIIEPIVALIQHGLVVPESLFGLADDPSEASHNEQAKGSDQ